MSLSNSWNSFSMSIQYSNLYKNASKWSSSSSYDSVLLLVQYNRLVLIKTPICWSNRAHFMYFYSIHVRIYNDDGFRCIYQQLVAAEVEMSFSTDLNSWQLILIPDVARWRRCHRKASFSNIAKVWQNNLFKSCFPLDPMREETLTELTFAV